MNWKNENRSRLPQPRGRVGGGLPRREDRDDRVKVRDITHRLRNGQLRARKQTETEHELLLTQAPQERVRQPTAEQTVDVPVTQAVEKAVERVAAGAGGSE